VWERWGEGEETSLWEITYKFSHASPSYILSVSLRDIAVLTRGSIPRYSARRLTISRISDSHILLRVNIVWVNETRLLKYLKDTHAASDRQGITYFASQRCTEEQFQRSRDLAICLATDDTAPATLFVWTYYRYFGHFK